MRIRKGIIMSEKKYKRRLGDRGDGRLVRNLIPMHKITPFIMVERNDASNFIRDSIEVSKIDEYIRRKRKSGLKGFGIMHIIVAAYIRCISQRPAVNRFVSGQRVYSRNRIEININVKKEMTLESPDTVVKIVFEPTDTADDVYYKMKTVIDESKGGELDSDFDNTARIINYIPRLIKKFAIWFLKTIDYFGLLPKFLLNVSPFHGSMFITSMGSLGIPPIYHHLYNFGNVPVFISFGAKKSVNEIDDNGQVVKRKYVDYTVVTDERICDGYYFASALKILRGCLRHPERLDTPPEQVIEDIF